MKNYKENMDLAVLNNEESEKGFTLIELIVVMAIIAILVLLAAPSFLNYTKDAKATALRQDAKVVSDAVIMFNIESDNEGWPISAETGKHQEVTDGVPFEAGTAINEDSLKEHVKNLSGNNDIGDFMLMDEKGKVAVSEADGAEDRDGNTVTNNHKDDDIPKE